ncbi:MAG: type II secretion system F family protein [Candidatus Diapherotrites archaeon]
MLNRIAARISDFLPQKIKDDKIRPLLEFAGSQEDMDSWLGKRMFLAFLFAAIGFLLPLTIGPFMEGLNLPIRIVLSFFLMVLFFVFVLFLYFLNLYYVIENRASIVEAILPDFLLLVTANLRAGMTPFAAFRGGARTEFGPLAEEVKIAASKSLGTSSFSDALKTLSLRIRSRSLKETVSFFSHALRAGGHLAKLLETTALDLRKTQEMRKDLESSTKMYVLFVVFVVVIASPLLMAVSVQFIDMITAIIEQSPSTAGSPYNPFPSDFDISVEFMRNLSYALFFGNSLLAGIFIGTLSDGKGLMGLKYFPAILMACFLVFFVAETILPFIVNV